MIECECKHCLEELEKGQNDCECKHCLQELEKHTREEDRKQGFEAIFTANLFRILQGGQH